MNNIPDATTFAFFRERFYQAESIKELFETFEPYLRDQGLQAHGGQIIDATLIPVTQTQASAQHRQRNSREDNKEIKDNRITEVWIENPNRLQQIDLDASWVRKNLVNHYGYQNNICIDVEYRFNRRYTVSPAIIHDSQMLPMLLDPGNTDDYV